MEKIILWILISYGMTSILVWGSIFEKVRQLIISNSKFFGDLISCVLCTSTWVGFFLSLTLGSLNNIYFHNNWILDIFFDGMFSAGSVWAINALVEFFEENRWKS